MAAELTTRKTGYAEHEALAFLFCDIFPRHLLVGVRWNAVGPRHRTDDAFHALSPTDVAIAYHSIRDAIFRKKPAG